MERTGTSSSCPSPGQIEGNAIRTHDQPRERSACRWRMQLPRAHVAATSVGQEVNEALLYDWYVSKEVKQNWFGFTILGNGGSGLGPDFARALHSNLPRLW
jgi:hypothetical protein